MENIIHYVSKKLNISILRILSQTRKREVVEARYITVALIVGKFNPGPSATMRFFNRDHSIYYHALGAIKDRCDTEKEFKRMFRKMCIENSVDPDFIDNDIIYK